MRRVFWMLLLKLWCLEDRVRDKVCERVRDKVSSLLDDRCLERRICDKVRDRVGIDRGGSGALLR